MKNHILNEEELYSIIKKGNEHMQILFDRIDFLYKLLDEEKEYKNMVKREGGSEQVCLEENKKFEKEVSLLKQKYENQLQENEERIEKLREVINQNNEKLSELLSADKIVYAYRIYQEIPEEIREEFEGIIWGKTIQSFVASIFNEDKLERLYSKIQDVIMREKENIEKQGKFSKLHKQLAFLFDFYFENILDIEEVTERKRLTVKLNSEYDDEFCVRIGNPMGRVEKILLQGFSYNGEIRKRSIVLIGQ